MTTSSRNARESRFLPEGVGAFLYRRLTETGGAGVIMLAAMLAAALLSYNPLDPSVNTSVAGRAGNWMGPPGAVIADILMQSIGLAGYLLAVVLFGWGWGLAAHRAVSQFWLRITMLPTALLLAAMALAAQAPSRGWGLRGGLGGFTGDMLLGKLATLGQQRLGIDPAVLSAVAGLLALIAALAAVGLRPREWRAAWRLARWLGWRVARTLPMAGRLMRGALRSMLGAARRGAPAEPTAPRARRERQEPHIGTAPVRPPRLLRIPLVEPKPGRAAAGKREEGARQATLDLVAGGEYQLPSLDLLHLSAASGGAASKDALEQNARLLESVLEDFGVRGEIVRVRPGPVVTLYELEPAPGIKSSRVIGLADDIARSMSAVSVRVALVPGRSVIGIELPNQVRETVSLRELLASEAYERTAAQLALALGKDIGGAPVIIDLARLPHLLVAGTTGSGKSVAINSMILSLIYRLPPERCRLVLIDPKMLELSTYDSIPHLLAPVVTDPAKAVAALRWAVREMENRYRLMSTLGVRNIAGYNARLAEAVRSGEQLSRRVQTGYTAATGEPIFEEQALDTKPLPFIVIVVDEMADLMMVAGREVEAAIQRLAQMARAAGIHLIMATQRPSVDVITGTIKANFPARVSFQVTSKIDSRTILTDGGAEQLLGHGDMLYMAPGGRITRVHGPLVTDDEVEAVAKVLRSHVPPVYVEDVTAEAPADESGVAAGGSGEDGLYDQAVQLICRERKASTSFVQRHLQIGYNRAARIIERMEAEGVVSRANHVGKREVLARDIDDKSR